jgi:hypothetical protein
MKQNKLTYDEAAASPCEACKPSICCYFLQLDSIKTQKLLDLDKINFYLNFPNIDICLTPAWEWLVYYNYPCRYYDQEESVCRIHNAGQQPGVCVNYNPYNCYYKRMKKTRDDLCPEMIWINRERMDFLMSQISFDDERIISEIPGNEKVLEAMSRIPYQVPDRVEAPKQEKTHTSNEVVVKSHLAFQNPCIDCASFCCRNLMFPQEKPSDYSSLDFIRYSLSFPGIELGISDEQWYIIARTTCLNCKGNRCTVYEKKERPLVCKYYNPMQCIHKECFGKKKTNGFIRVGYEAFNTMIETSMFDEHGDIIEGYDVKSLRERWTVQAPTASPSF